MAKNFPSIIYIAIINVICSCQNPVEKQISRMIGQTVHLDTCRMEKIFSEVILLPHADSHNKNMYTLICYIDSTECMSCMTGKMHGWDGFISKMSNRNDMSDIVFIFTPSKEETVYLRHLLMSEKLIFNVYIDTIGVFAKQNGFIPQAPLYHTFLVDGNNKVILVGDPRRNSKIEELFWELLKAQ